MPQGTDRHRSVGVQWDEATHTYMRAEQYRATYGEPRQVWLEDLPEIDEEQQCQDQRKTQ
jgi:hypothetical protein